MFHYRRVNENKTYRRRSSYSDSGQPTPRLVQKRIASWRSWRPWRSWVAHLFPTEHRSSVLRGKTTEQRRSWHRSEAQTNLTLANPSNPIMPKNVCNILEVFLWKKTGRLDDDSTGCWPMLSSPTGWPSDRRLALQNMADTGESGRKCGRKQAWKT